MIFRMFRELGVDLTVSILLWHATMAPDYIWWGWFVKWATTIFVPLDIFFLLAFTAMFFIDPIEYSKKNT